MTSPSIRPEKIEELIAELRAPQGGKQVRWFSAIKAEAVATALESLKAENDSLREALKPFAEAAGDLEETHKDHHDLWESPASMNISGGDLRAARAFLTAQEVSDNG